MTERKVKGSMLMDQVRLIRNNKDRDWDKYIEPEDWEIIKGTILPSKWYPLELYRKFGWATFNVLAEGRVDLVRLRGLARGRELFGDIYKNVVVDNNPMESLNRFVTVYGLLFNFSTLKFEKVGDKHARVLHDYDPEDPTNIPYCHQLMGHLDALIEMTGGKNIKNEIIEKQWEKAPATIFDITWE